jgi:hypothetical protein
MVCRGGGLSGKGFVKIVPLVKWAETCLKKIRKAQSLEVRRDRGSTSVPSVPMRLERQHMGVIKLQHGSNIDHHLVHLYLMKNVTKSLSKPLEQDLLCRRVEQMQLNPLLIAIQVDSSPLTLLTRPDSTSALPCTSTLIRMSTTRK